MDDELLIYLVEQNPHLYNKCLKDYKDDKKKENTWVSIADLLNSTPDCVKKRWDNLRDRFVRAHREYKRELPSGSAGKKKKIDFKYFELMMWLSSLIRKRKLTSSVRPSCSSIIDTIDLDESLTNNDSQSMDGEEELLVIDMSDRGLSSPEPMQTSQFSSSHLRAPRAESCNTPAPPYPTQSSTRKTLHNSMAEAINNFNKACATRNDTQQPSASRSVTLFMTSIVEDMQTLTPTNKIKFKKEVMEVLIKYIDSND